MKRRSMKYDVKKLQWIGFLLGLVFTVALVISAINQYMHNSRFQPVRAKLVRVDARYGTNSDTRMTVYKTAYYEYIVEGKKYVSPQAIWLVSFRKIGTMCTVRYNPTNPTELENTYQWHTTIIALGMLVLFSIGMGKVLLPDIMRYFV